MLRPALASRRPPSYPVRARLWRLKVAGLADVVRLKTELTMLMVEAVPEVVSDEPATVAVPFETMQEMVFSERSAA